MRAARILPAGAWDAAAAVDRVTLDHDARHRRRFAYTGAKGTAFLLDLPAAIVLADGDGLVLEDGRIVAVVAADEPLIEVRAATPALLMRLAWHIGNRHLPADIDADRIRLRADHVIAGMLRGLGGDVAEIDAPFAPERGAYAGGGHGGHDHGDGGRAHDHGGHDHGGHGHDAHGHDGHRHRNHSRVHHHHDH